MKITCALFVMLLAAPAFAAAPQTFSVSGPTIIAFCPVTQAQLDKDADLNTMFDDFSFYASIAEKHYQGSHISFHQAYESRFRLKQGKRITEFNPKHDCGYYFVAPGRQPRIDRDGVKVSEEIYAAAAEYFRTAPTHPSHR